MTEIMVAFILLATQLGTAVPAVPSAEPTSVRPASTATLTLSAAVAQARSASLRRRGTALLADAARIAERSAGRLPNPEFELRAENWTPVTRDPLLERDVFAVVTQPFEFGGKRAIRRQLAGADTAVAAAALQTLDQELALETVRVYVRALRARALVETLTANRDGLTMLLATTSRRVDEGYSAEADLLKFRTEAAQVDSDIARARLELDRSVAALGIIIGAAASIQPSQLVEPSPLPVPHADAETVAASIARHPHVLAATAAVTRATRMTALERARRHPDPAVTGGYKRTAGVDTAVLGVSLTVPLFDRNEGGIARSVGAERAAAADRDALVHQLTADVSSIVRAAQTISDESFRAATALLGPAEAVRRAALAAFREGASDVLKLIDAERVYADVTRAAIDLRLEALLTTIEARFALGEETIP